MSLIILPSSSRESRKRFNDTIDPGCLISDIKPYMSETVLPQIEKNGKTRIGVWGFTDREGSNNKTLWNRIEPGDLVLFYSKHRFFCKGKVVAKEINSRLAHYLWNQESDGVTWDLVYYIDNLRPIDIPWIPEKVGYQSNAVFQGSMVIPKGNYRYERFMSYLEEYSL